MQPKKPERKRDGRDSPPSGYPKDPALYGDPTNWKYPLDTRGRARLARRYFSDPANRRKYTPEEQLFIDQRIDAALKRFGLGPGKGPKAPRKAAKQEKIAPPAPPPVRLPKSEEELNRLGLEEMLLVLVGAERLARAEDIAKDRVQLEDHGPDFILAAVKEYTVLIDGKTRRIEHDCPDFGRRSQARLFCKHVGAALLAAPPAEADALCRAVLKARDEWIFTTGAM